MIKKSAGILLSVLLLFMALSACPVSAFIDTDKTVYEEAVNLLGDLGVITGMTAEYYMPNKDFTRAEAATVMARLTGIPFEEKKSDVFEDVPEDHWANSAVSLCHELNIIHGMDETHFMPDETVSYAQLAKMLVSFAGYAPAAEAAGGYPAGYLMKATQLEILSEGSGECTRGEMARMVYKTLFVPVFLPTAYGDESGTYETGKTVLEYYLHIEKYSGIVTADTKNSMRGDTFAKDGEIHIDGKAFVWENEKAEEFFGKKITFYVRENSDDIPVILSADISKNVTTVQIKADELLPETTKTSAYYARGTGKKEKIDISNARLIKNGAEIIGWSEKDIQIQNGTIAFILNDGNSADVILVKSYENYVVDSVSSYTSTVRLKKNEVMDSINLTEGEEYEYIYIYDTDGKSMELSALAEWNILSVYAAHDKSILRVIVSVHSTVGKIEEISSDNYVTVSGSKYAADATFVNKVQVGQNAEFYLDHQGKLAAYNARVQKDDIYGYLLAAECDKGLNAQVRMKILTENDEIKVFTLSEKIEFNGYMVEAKKLFDKSGIEGVLLAKIEALFDGEDVLPQLITFRLNDAEKISSIYTAEDGTMLSAETRENVFSLDAVETMLQLINAGMLCDLGTRYYVKDTLIFNVAPSYTGNNDYDFSVKTISSLVHGNGYSNFSLYDVDALNRPAVMLIKGGVSNEGSLFKSRAGLVTQIGEGMTEDGMVCKTIKVVGMNSEQEETFYNLEDVEAVYKRSVLSDPQKDTMATGGVLPDTIKHVDIAPGDIVKIEANAKKEIISMAVLVRAESPQIGERAYKGGLTAPPDYDDYYDGLWIYVEVEESEPGIYKYMNPYERIHPYNETTFIFEWDIKEQKARRITGADIEKGDMLASSRMVSNERLIVVYR